MATDAGQTNTDERQNIVSVFDVIVGRSAAPTESINLYSPSSASRTFFARPLVVNGFCRKCTPGSRTP